MQIKWSDDAIEELNAALEYGVSTFGENAAKRFYENLLENESILLTNPRIGQNEPLLVRRSQNFRSRVVHKHYKLVYYIEVDIIYIVALFDTRRNPASLANHIK